MLQLRWETKPRIATQPRRHYQFTQTIVLPLSPSTQALPTEAPAGALQKNQRTVLLLPQRSRPWEPRQSTPDVSYSHSTFPIDEGSTRYGQINTDLTHSTWYRKHTSGTKPLTTWETPVHSCFSDRTNFGKATGHTTQPLTTKSAVHNNKVSTHLDKSSICNRKRASRTGS